MRCVVIVNNVQNSYGINEVYASKPLKNETSSLSANIMLVPFLPTAKSTISRCLFNSSDTNSRLMPMRLGDSRKLLKNLWIL